MEFDSPRALLFDLGGVLIDIDFGRALQAWHTQSRLSLDELARAFSFDELYERHERGEIAAAEYFEHLANVLELENNHSLIAEGWNSIYIGEIAETTALVKAARSNIPCYAFTNTNAAHMSTWTVMFPEVVAVFDGIFASHELGLRKPEQEAFACVADAIGVSPRSIVFFDDLAKNVRVATAMGFQAVLVESPADVRNALVPYIGC
jgi:putative hydrolase of the HAD superfamily